MLDWHAISSDEIMLLAIIADSYDWGISTMLRHLDALTEEQRAAVIAIVERMSAAR